MGVARANANYKVFMERIEFMGLGRERLQFFEDIREMIKLRKT